MRLYGGVNGIPIVIEPVTGIENAYVPQSPASKVYEQIISDFEYAAGLNDDAASHFKEGGPFVYLVEGFSAYHLPVVGQ